MSYGGVGSKQKTLCISKKDKEQICRKLVFGLVSWKSLLKECKSQTVQNGVFYLPVTQILIIVNSH